MSIIGKLLAASPSEFDDFWYRPVGFPSLTGIRLTPEATMRLAVVFTCVRIVSETVAVPPLKIYRRRNDSGKDEARNHPLFFRMHDAPNEIQTSPEYREMMQGHLSLRGNAYSQIVPGPRGRGDILLIPLRPDRVLPIALPSGKVGYIYTPPVGPKVAFSQEEIFHLRGLSNDGISGLSPMDLLTEPVSMAKAAEAYASRFFHNDGSPGGYIKHPKALGPKAKDTLLQWWKENYQGFLKAHNPAIFEEGMEWVNVGMEPEKMQLVATREYQTIEISAAFRVPLHLVNRLTKPAYASILHMSLEFITYDRMPDFVKWEKRIDVSLLGDDNFFAEHVVEGFLRGDIQTRYEAYSRAVGGPWMDRNEVRIRENLNPREGLDDILQPVNMQRVGEQIGMVVEDSNRAAQILKSAAGRVSRREIGALTKCLERSGGDGKVFRDSVLKFYEDHARFVSDALALDEEKANHYVLFQSKRICEASNNGTIPHLLKELNENGAQWILTMTEDRNDGEKEELSENHRPNGLEALGDSAG